MPDPIQQQLQRQNSTAAELEVGQIQEVTAVLMAARELAEQDATNRQTSVAQQTIDQFATAVTLPEALLQIRCGLEFEFHSLDGSSDPMDLSGDDDGDNVDLDRLHEESLEAWDALTMREIIDCQGGNKPEYDQLLLAMHGNGVELSVLPKSLQDKLDVYLDNMQTEYRDNFEQAALDDNYSSYIIRPDYAEVLAGYKSSMKGKFEIGEDGSVRGGELRTLGPLVSDEFLDIARMIAANDFEVDFGCSFHIHLSLPGVKHVYGQKFQAEMYAYLLSPENYARLPEGVKRRLVHEGGGMQWANFTVANDNKYVAIYRHSQNTWEFRLFGNVSTYAEMEVCLHLATEALQHAYRVKLGILPSLVRGKNLAKIRRALDLVKYRKALGEFSEVLRTVDENAYPAYVSDGDLTSVHRVNGTQLYEGTIRATGQRIVINSEVRDERRAYMVVGLAS